MVSVDAVAAIEAVELIVSEIVGCLASSETELALFPSSSFLPSSNSLQYVAILSQVLLFPSFMIMII